MMNLEKTIEALKSNRMDVYYVHTAEEAKALVLSMIPEGSTCVSGGSVTLAETGIIDAIKNGAYHYIDRSLPDLTQEQKDDAMRAAFGADFYLSSANAITEDGELYNVDGEAIESAPHPYMEFSAKVPFPVKAGDIVRAV